MRHEDRKAALAAYRERKVFAGVWRLVSASGEAWVGTAADLATIENRVRFTLGHGSHPNGALQRAWTAAGGEGFSFEVLERFEEERDIFRRARLRESRERWCEKLGALPA